VIWFQDVHGRKIRFTDERRKHIEEDHPEMQGQIDKIRETLADPELIVRSRADPMVELFYRHYRNTPVMEKYLCVVVKTVEDSFLITAYFTDAIKRGEILWGKR